MILYKYPIENNNQQRCLCTNVHSFPLSKAMLLEEWKAYRNKRIKENKDSIKSTSQKLGIDINLARDILNGDYDHQIRFWDKLQKK